MSISVKVILDSVAPNGKRITTFQIRYPRFIHAEFMTHRVFSRNASSSRAIPVKTIIADIRKDPAMPVHWGRNQPGMQAQTELTGWRRWATRKLWMTGMYGATSVAKLADRVGAHKQIVNRIVEPWSHISVVVTSTEWSNFYALRAHPDAQPEIKALAEAMLAAQNASTPQVLKKGEWHIPYIRDEDRAAAAKWVEQNGDRVTFRTLPDELRLELDVSTETLLLIGVSVARCARTSYTLHDGKPTTFEKDFQLYQRLLGSDPVHASPAEHQAMALGDIRDHYSLQGNFAGFAQYRKTLVGESQ